LGNVAHIKPLLRRENNVCLVIRECVAQGPPNEA